MYSEFDRETKSRRVRKIECIFVIFLYHQIIIWSSYKCGFFSLFSFCKRLFLIGIWKILRLTHIFFYGDFGTFLDILIHNCQITISLSLFESLSLRWMFKHHRDCIFVFESSIYDLLILKLFWVVTGQCDMFIVFLFLLVSSFSSLYIYKI